MATLLMTRHTRSTPPHVTNGGAAAASVFTLRMLDFIFDMEQERRKAALDDWENEGGTVAVSDSVATNTFPIDTENMVQGKAMPQHRHGPDTVRNAFYAADSVSPDVAGQSSSANHACPRCDAPLDRVQRRIVDRLVSWFTPVRRYRCRMKGWSCDWEGNLRTK